MVSTSDFRQPCLLQKTTKYVLIPECSGVLCNPAERQGAATQHHDVSMPTHCLGIWAMLIEDFLSSLSFPTLHIHIPAHTSFLAEKSGKQPCVHRDPLLALSTGLQRLISCHWVYPRGCLKALCWPTSSELLIIEIYTLGFCYIYTFALKSLWDIALGECGTGDLIWF